MEGRIDIDSPRYDQSTYLGRAKHFFITTNPLNLLATKTSLERAKHIVTKYRKDGDLGELSVDQLWSAKQLYDSAYHPDTGELMIMPGRMSFQVPGNMTITGCMMTFYKSAPAVIFWQWINQTFNAIVNYTNRSGDAPIPMQRLGLSYVLATGGAVATALGINRTVSKLPPLVGRFVPFTAVAAANCINIPCMRSQELREGIPVFDRETGERLGKSPAAAKKAIFQVVVSRIIMAMPGMLTPPLLMNYLERRGVLARMPWISAPLQVALCGAILTFATPMCCALFPQQSSIAVSSAEPDIQEAMRRKGLTADRVYFNKGL